MSNDMIKKVRAILEDVINSASNVFIVGHNDPDYDSIASALGLSTLCSFFAKKSYIIVDDPDIELDPGVKKILDDNRKNYNIINKETFEKLKNKRSILIVTDVNSVDRISVKDYLDEFKEVVVIDHHHLSDKTIETDKRIIDEKVSSASEVVARVLNSCKVKYGKVLSNYLLAGIILDTNRYMKNTLDKTYDVAEKLMRNGADSDYVNDLFLTEFDDEGKIALLIHSNGNTNFQLYNYSLFQEYNVAFTLNREMPNAIYKKINIAKAADKMLDFKIDAAFVLGYVNEDTVTISARSKSDIDVGEIMRHMCGGGNPKNAATRIENVSNIFDIEKELMQQVQWGIKVDDIVEELPENSKKLLKTTKNVGKV